MKKYVDTKQLEVVVDEFLKLIHDNRVTDLWRRRDLKHVAFWHSYYAKTVSSITSKKDRIVLKGTYKLINSKALLDFEVYSNDELVSMITKSQGQFLKNIGKLHEDILIPYKAGSRLYSPQEYIDVISDHFKMHNKYLRDMIKKSSM